MDEVRKLAKEHKPKLLWAGTTAYPRTLDFAAFRSIADEVGAILAADIAHISGLVATGVHPSPVGIADVVTSTTHKTFRGPRGGMILCKKQHARADRSTLFSRAFKAGRTTTRPPPSRSPRTKRPRPDSCSMQRTSSQNAKALGEALARQGFHLVTGGTDNHLLLVDLTNKNVAGQSRGAGARQGGHRRSTTTRCRSIRESRSIRRASASARPR